MLDAREKLNALRNKLGHSLEPAQIEGQIKAFVRLFEDPKIPVAEFQSEQLARRLKRSISFLCGELHGMQEGHVAMRTAQKRK